ncbi:F-box/kelch-repeat protein [Platanthera zijinensis]|uniref:F-box/kelch-repeat protein n=1 Tax=Platanthera zijinensis TaxID=2320716 RepID=A0AAP0G440_9ASPA
MKNLIPGLPEEIGMECLIRVPHDTFPLLRQVCRRWKKAVESPLYHLLRRSAASSRRLIIFSQAHPSPSNESSAAAAQKHPCSLPPFRLAALRPTTGEWAHLPPIPGLSRGLPLFSGLASAGTNLILVGGWDPDTWAPSSAVYIFSFLSGSWRRGCPMPGPSRSFFACAAAPDGQVFVAGGHDEEKNALRSAMVYDVGSDDWTVLPEMAAERDECTGLFDVNENLFRVIGGYCTSMQGMFGESAEAFDVGERRWREAENAAVEDGECARTCAAGGDGRIYMYGRGRRSVVVKEGEGWREVAGVPENVRMASQMVACDRGLMIVVGSGSAGGSQAAYLLEMKQGEAAAWQRVEMPREYSGYVQSGCCIEI